MTLHRKGSSDARRQQSGQPRRPPLPGPRFFAGSGRADRSRRPSLPAPRLLALPSNKEPRPLTLNPLNKRELGCSPAAVGPTASSVIASAPMVAGSSRADRLRRPSLPAPCSFALPSNKEPRPLTLDPAYKRELERSPAAVGSTASPVLPAPRSVQQEPRAPRELQLPRARCSIWPAPPVPRGRCSKCESEAPPAALVRCLAEPSPPAPRGR